jgi:uncharacterized RDD family membrane protein YckC
MIEEKIYAGFWVRLFAGFLDLIFLAVPIALISFLIGDNSYEVIKVGDNFSSFSFDSYGNLHLIDLLIYIVSIIYIAYFLASNQQATIGKRLMGIYVGNPDGSKLCKARATARACASIVTSLTLGLGFIAVIFNKEKISLHDFMCHTRVFHGKK